MKYEVKDLNAPSRWNMRIWDDIKKEWLCQSDQKCLTYYGFDIKGGETTEFQGLPNWNPDRHLIWEQSTGLKDKNGKEIYEGDIVRLSVEDDFKKEYFSYYKHELPLGVHKVTFENGAFSICENDEWRFLLGQYRSNEIEVIGNIHENPEFLGGEE